MNYYNQNVSCRNSYDIPAISNTSTSGQNIPLYPNVDPRMNYSNYNTVPSSSSVMYPNNMEMYDLSLPNETVATVKTDEELWIETWLSKIGKIQINLNSTIEIPSQNKPKNEKCTKSVIQIHAASNALQNSIRVLEKLESLCELLKLNADKMTSIEWKQKTTEIGIIKEEFSKLFCQFENPIVVTNLRKAVENRRKKRLGQKRRKKENAVNKAILKTEKKEAEKKIDEWLERMKDEVERAKMVSQQGFILLFLANLIYPYIGLIIQEKSIFFLNRLSNPIEPLHYNDPLVIHLTIYYNNKI